jgi:hypothetical protein
MGGISLIVLCVPCPWLNLIFVQYNSEAEDKTYECQYYLVYVITNSIKILVRYNQTVLQYGVDHLCPVSYGGALSSDRLHFPGRDDRRNKRL